MCCGATCKDCVAVPQAKGALRCNRQSACCGATRKACVAVPQAKRALRGGPWRAASSAGRPIFKVCPGSYFGTLGWSKSDSSRNLIQVSQVIIIFRPFFLKIMILEKLFFPQIVYFFTFDRYFEAWEHQNRTRHEKLLPGSYSETF